MILMTRWSEVYKIIRLVVFTFLSHIVVVIGNNFAANTFTAKKQKVFHIYRYNERRFIVFIFLSHIMIVVGTLKRKYL